MNLVINDVMNASRHKFVYCEKREEQEAILSRVNHHYPVVIGGNNPIAVRIVNGGLPEMDVDVEKDRNVILIASFHRNYYEFLVALNIVDVLLSQVSYQVLDDLMRPLFDKYNKYVNTGFKKIGNIQDFRDILYKGMLGYYKRYVSYLKESRYDEADIPLSCVLLSTFLRDVKKALGIRTYFGILFNCPHELSLTSQKAINGFISQRCNDDMSVNVICLSDEWKTHYDLNDNFVEYTHDYTIVRVGGRDSRGRVKKIR